MASVQGKKVVHIHHGTQNYKTVMTAGRHELLADEPLDQAGMDTGPDPYDYLLMSLGACTAITLKMYADRKKWPVEDIYVEMTHEKAIPSERSDESEASRASGVSGVSGVSTQKIDRIEKEILIKGDLDESQLDRMLQISHKCPVNKTLQGTSIEMKASIRKL